MKKYEAMFIVKPDLSAEEKDSVVKMIKEQITKQNGTVVSDEVWAERKKLAYDLFPVGGQARFKEGTYYLIYFQCEPTAVSAIKSGLGLNENILRYLILKVEEKKKSEQGVNQ